MQKDNITHFVGFITKQDSPEFMEQWKQYVKVSSPGREPVLQERTEGTSKFHYVSQHHFNEENFRFSILKGKGSENFTDPRSRVLMLGGYTAVETEGRFWSEKSDIKLLLFFTQDRIDINEYRSLIKSACMNIYQPFYENCTYSYILEIYTRKALGENLLSELLKKKDGAEISMYRKCRPNVNAAKHLK